MKQKLILQAIYFLLITLVINAGGWAFNKDALGDTLFSKMGNVIEVNKAHSSVPEGAESIGANTCNHWCHAGINLLGMTSQLIIFMPRLTVVFSTIHFANPLHFSPESLFRPPRTSLA